MFFMGIVMNFFISMSYAEIGRIVRIVDNDGAYIKREKTELKIKPNMALEAGDEVISNESRVLVHLYPGTQLSMDKSTKVVVHKKLIKFFKGLVRVKVIKKQGLIVQQIVASEDVSFNLSEGDFELALSSKNVDLDVHEGEITVSSPHIQTFVPEIIKTKEGFTFTRNQYSFLRRKFAPRFNNHPGFTRKVELHKKRK